MRTFLNQDTGEFHKTEKTRYWLGKCPKCNENLYWNSYSDKYVVDRNNKNEISFDLKIEYCTKCETYYVCIE